ncbi:imidazole glycerol phosphate synthase subunit HisF [Francisella salimarina]|uniref:imidazole glycerol phosphate synthase subunit HisF n=1 Tax=Francisella salimarina TaxID=2599927 RepID=UPI003750D825
MLTKRIIPCLDVKDGIVVKGVKFRNHRIIGDIIELAQKYSDAGADELVFYDIGASPDNKLLSIKWIQEIAKKINIPFCVAGGIKSVENARAILNEGADKISVNSAALARPDLIDELVYEFGSQCVVVGIDSKFIDGEFKVCQYTGSADKTVQTLLDPISWAKEVESRGAGEIVLNCMNQDGVKGGYDLEHLREVQSNVSIPVIASGGAGEIQHFIDVFKYTEIDGALAASVFHDDIIAIPELKQELFKNNIPTRIVK